MTDDNNRRKWSPNIHVASPSMRHYETLTISPTETSSEQDGVRKSDTPLAERLYGSSSNVIKDRKKVKTPSPRSRFGFLPKMNFSPKKSNSPGEEMKVEVSPRRSPTLSNAYGNVEMILGAHENQENTPVKGSSRDARRRLQESKYQSESSESGLHQRGREGISVQDASTGRWATSTITSNSGASRDSVLHQRGLEGFSVQDASTGRWATSTITSNSGPWVPPTELHELCLTMSSRDELLKAKVFLRGAARVQNGSVLNCAAKTDKLGRTPLHLFSLNKPLAASLGKHFGFENETKRYLQSHQHTLYDEDLFFEQKVQRFLTGHLLPAHPGAMLIRDILGHIPFEGSLVDWVDFSHQYGKTTKESQAGSKKVSSLTQVWESTSHTVLSAVRLAGRQMIKVTNDGQDPISISSPHGRDPSTGENPRFVFQTAEEASDAHINLGAARSSTGGLLEAAYKASTFPPNVRLNDHVRFVLVMLSATIDQLDRYMSPEVYQNGLSESEEDSFCRAMRELSTFRELYGTIDISATVVQIVASIPEFMKTILLIEDDEERQFALSTSIVRRVMMNELTIGGWVTSMLQSKDKEISKRVIDYLKFVSEISRGDQAQKGGRRTRFDRDLKDNKDLTGCDALINEISRLENFVPALLALGNRGMEEVSSTFVVQRVLDRMIARPFAVTVVFCDVIFLSLLIVGFRSAVNQLIVGASLSVVLQWIYVANTGIFYFVIREIGKTVSLCVISKRARVYFVSFWNLIDMLATILALTATISMRYHFTFQERGLEDASILRGLLAVTTGFLWLRVLSLLKAINRQLATFVLAILQITRDIFWFCVILLTMIISFAQIFYTLLAPSTCASGNPNAMQCSQTEFLLSAYSVLLGDFGNFRRDDFKSGFTVFLIVFYSFMVTVILLNVLIAVASDSYEKCLLRSVKLFGRARVMLIAELASFQNLLRKTDQRTEELSYSTTIYSQFWSSRPWNHDWSRGSVLFFSLSLLVIVAWIVCEIMGYSRGQHHGSIVLSLASIFVNVVLFVAIMAFLSSGATGVASKKDPSDLEDGDIASTNTRDWNNGFVQNVMLRVLGASKPTDNDECSTTNGVEDWNGRVHYLHREMSRLSEEAVVLANEQSKAMENLVKLSESRLRTEFGSLERNFEYLRRDLMGEIQGTKETNALVSHAAEELKTLIAMQSSTDCGFTLQTSPVPSVLDLNQTKFVRHDKHF